MIAAILLKMVVPNLLGGSEAARKNTLINCYLKGFHCQAALRNYLSDPEFRGTNGKKLFAANPMHT